MGNKEDGEYMEARSRMEEAIGEFHKAAMAAEIERDYIVEDITAAVSNATDEDIELVED
jgi:hypothetical protein